MTNKKVPYLCGGVLFFLLVQGEYDRKLQKSTSQFFEYRIDRSVYIPFNDPLTASGYGYDITNSYTSVFARYINFPRTFSIR